MFTTRVKQRNPKAVSSSPPVEKASSRSRRSSPTRDRQRRASRSPQRASHRQASRSPVNSALSSRDTPVRRSNVNLASSLLSEAKKSQRAAEKLKQSEKRRKQLVQAEAISIHDSPPDDSVDHREIPLPPQSDSHSASVIETAATSSSAHAVSLTTRGDNSVSGGAVASISRLQNSGKQGADVRNDYTNSQSSSPALLHKQRDGVNSSRSSGACKSKTSDNKVLAKVQSKASRSDCLDSGRNNNGPRTEIGRRSDVTSDASRTEIGRRSDVTGQSNADGNTRLRERSPEIVRSQLAKLPMPPTPPEQRTISDEREDNLQR